MLHAERHPSTARSKRAGVFWAGVADCLTDPGIVCFPAASPLKAQTDVPCAQRGSITRPEKEFRRTRPETPRTATARYRNSYVF